jgi:hypothetical protein
MALPKIQGKARAMMVKLVLVEVGKVVGHDLQK